jgi:S1-C subfamily serine protease
MLSSIVLAAFAGAAGITGDPIRPATSAPATLRGVRSADEASALRDSLGLELAVTQSLVRRRIISTRTPYGFLVSGVVPGSPAARAGLATGDVLLEWEGEPIRSVQQLVDLATASGVAILYARKRPGVPLTFPATDPWEARRTRVKPIRAADARRPV